jgi:hypothetical protein
MGFPSISLRCSLPNDFPLRSVAAVSPMKKPLYASSAAAEYANSEYRAVPAQGSTASTL